MTSLVTSPADGGLGPRFNYNSCASCHTYPAVGGSSPPSNPLFSIYNENGAHQYDAVFYFDERTCSRSAVYQ